MAHDTGNLRGERENRRTKRGIRKGSLRVHQVKKTAKRAASPLFYGARKSGKHIKSTRSRLYRGA